MSAQTLRIATYNTELLRAGPGLLLRDILSEKDQQVEAVCGIFAAAQPDIIVLQGVDYDWQLAALMALRDKISALGQSYPHIYATRPNTGMASGLDLDGDGRLGAPADAQGFGFFAGQGGMAVLSRHPFNLAAAQDFSGLIWADLPNALLPQRDGLPFPSPQVQQVQRLSTTGHWAVPVRLPSGNTLWLLTFHASPPVFDGPEDRNGKRNHDEAAFWSLYLNGEFETVPDGLFVVLGDANLDARKGNGRPEALRALLEDPRLQDPEPRAVGGIGEAAMDTVDWPQPGPGRMRVDYVLPSSDIEVLDAGVVWPKDDATARKASRHRLVWVDVVLP